MKLLPLLILIPLTLGFVIPDQEATLNGYINAYGRAITPDTIPVDALAIFTYEEIEKIAQILQDAVKNVRISLYIQTKDYANLQAELKGVIPDEKIVRLIGLLQKTVKPEIVPIDWVLWRNEYRSPDNVPDGDVFMIINDLNVGFEKIYDSYFNMHKGKTLVAFSWEIAGDNYIRQYMYQFGLRYENKIYAVIPNYGGHNNIDFKGDYAEYYEPIGQVVWWFKANTNLPVGLTICSVRDDSDDRFAEAMKDLPYDFVYLWGLHDFNYDFGIEFGQANKWANGRPVILGGFWGSQSNPLGKMPDAVLTDMSFKFPSFVSMRKSEGWKGLHIIGERWDMILEKCKNRGITVASQ